jgi:hypothetical protein
LSRRRTSAQGTVLTARQSSSARRRWISVDQAASASSCISGSRLWSKDAANAARSSLGSASASLRMSASLRFTVRFYEVQSWARHHRKPSQNALRTRGISFLWRPSHPRKRRKSGGNANAGAPFPQDRTQFPGRDTHAGVLAAGAWRDPNSLIVLHFARCHRAALCAARVLVRAAVDVAVSDRRGVSDPLCHPPFFAPWSSWRGSLTPNTDVSFVRTNSACL